MEKNKLNHFNQQKQARVLDGLKASGAIISCIRDAIDIHVETVSRRPGLAVVLVGSDPASSIYVRAKRNDCRRVGILSRDYNLVDSTSESDLLEKLDVY